MGDKLSKDDLTVLTNQIKGQLENQIATNGLGAAIFGSGFPTGGFGFGGPGTQQVSQVGEIFNNLRWYFLSNMRQALSEAYCELGLVQTVCNVPVADALRGDIEITSKELTPDELLKLHDVIDREGDIETLAQSLIWDRLFGGAGVIVVTDQDYSTPLDTETLKVDDKLAYQDCDMWELYFSNPNLQGFESKVDAPGLTVGPESEYYTYYGLQIHKSRVFKLSGVRAPSMLRPRLRGWGLSVIEALVRSINQYLEGTDLLYELIAEAKIDVFGIKNLTNTLLAPTGTQQVAQRVQLANQQKDFQHALVMDAEDKYEQKTMSFSGFADVMHEVRLQVASDLRMPMTKLFGMSAAGFNSGEDDIEVYNGMLEGTIRKKAKVPLLSMVELRCQVLFGFVPEDLGVAFAPLRVMSSEEEEKVKTRQFNRIQKAYETHMISLDEARDSLNKEDLMGIQLEKTPTEGSDAIGAEAADQMADAQATDTGTGDSNDTRSVAGGDDDRDSSDRS